MLPTACLCVLPVCSNVCASDIVLSVQNACVILLPLQEYLQAKQARMNHLFEVGESCFWNHQEGGVSLPAASQAQGSRTGAKVQLPDLGSSSVSSQQQQAAAAAAAAAAEQILMGGSNGRSSSPSAR